MIWFYRLVFIPIVLVASPYYVKRMLKRGGYKTNFGQRFGALPLIPAKRSGIKRIWIQAVSVGEMLAIGPLLEALHETHRTEVYLTTTTSTGYRMALDRYSHLTMAIGYFPMDWWPFSARVWRKVQPEMVILTEGERWPEHIAQARKRGVPVLCINARLSDKSYRRMTWLKFTVRRLFRGITHFLASSQQDKERLEHIDIPNAKILMTGNIKLDINIPIISNDLRENLRAEVGLAPDHLVLFGSSTWPGEERSMVEALRSLRAAGVRASLLLVPRHAERRSEISAFLRSTGLRFHLRSTGPCSSQVDVSVADTTGELRRLLQLADIVFVGKSLPPHHEGQTPVEAAVLGKAILFGPEMSNFRQISRELLACKAAKTVRDEAELSATVLALAADPEERERMARAAREWHSSNRGAVARTIQVIMEQLGFRAKVEDSSHTEPLKSSLNR